MSLINSCYGDPQSPAFNHQGPSERRNVTSVTDQLLAELAELVQEERPRFFAIYGLYEHPPVEEGADPRYVEWGMEFPGDQIAITWSPGELLGSMAKSSSAEHLLKDAERMGPARLIWFDQEGFK